MSPHVNNFVTDLVAMAKAMEELPEVKRELEHAISDNEHCIKTIQARELHIIELKTEVEKHLSTIRSLEVARDDAELRFLELDEKARKVVNTLNEIMGLSDSIQSKVRDAKELIDLPKPQPMPEPITVPITEQGQSASSPTVGTVETSSYTIETAPITHGETSGQSEPLPTATSMENQSTSAPSTVENMDTVVASEPTPLPYSGLRYHEYHSWVSLDNWLTGGGTQENYDWRPNRVSHW